MTQTSHENIVNFSGGSVRFTLTAPVDGNDYDLLVAMLAQTVHTALIPGVNTKCDAAGPDDTPNSAELEKTYLTPRGLIRLRVKVYSSRPVNLGQLYHVVEHEFVETHVLVDLVNEPSLLHGNAGTSLDPLTDAILSFMPFMSGASGSAKNPFDGLGSDGNYGMSTSRRDNVRSRLQDLNLPVDNQSSFLHDIPGVSSNDLPPGAHPSSSGGSHFGVTDAGDGHYGYGPRG